MLFGVRIINEALNELQVSAFPPNLKWSFRSLVTDSRKIAKVTAEYQDWVAKAAAMAQESIGSLRTVRSFAAEQHQVDGYTRLIGKPERPCGPCSPLVGAAL